MKLISRGTYGKVYKKTVGDEEFAYKKFRDDITDDSSIVKELAVLALVAKKGLKHCIQAIEFDFTEEYIGILMPLAVGDLWKLQEDMEFSHIADYTIAGMLEIHNLGIVHGDIKFANYLVFSDNSIKLGDYGFSSNHPAQTDTHIYTYTYRAPEVWLKKQSSKKSDVWALGVSLLEFFSDEEDEIFDQFKKKSHIEREVIEDVIDDALGNVDSDFIDLIAGMTEYNPEKRKIVIPESFVHSRDVQMINVSVQKKDYKILAKAIFKKCGEKYYNECLKIAYDWYEMDDSRLEYTPKNVCKVLKNIGCMVYEP